MDTDILEMPTIVDTASGSDDKINDHIGDYSDEATMVLLLPMMMLMMTIMMMMVI